MTDQLKRFNREKEPGKSEIGKREKGQYRESRIGLSSNEGMKRGGGEGGGEDGERGRGRTRF